jgi:hypothetical protein
VAQAVQVVVQITRHHSGRRFISSIAVVDPTYLLDGAIRPQPVFIAETSPTGAVQHRRTGVLGADTQLAAKLRNAGEEVETWTRA